jgi:hypothetical protein
MTFPDSQYGPDDPMPEPPPPKGPWLADWVLVVIALAVFLGGGALIWRLL